MQMRSSDSDYGAVSKLLHWSIGLLIIGLIWLGWYMVDLSYFHRWYNSSLAAHKALGILVLELALLKLLWTATNRAPSPLQSLKAWERAGAKATHHFLILMMFLLPLTGYGISTSEGQPVSFFGLYDVPAWLPESAALRDWAIELHFYLAYLTAAVVGMHVLAALKHQFIDKNGILKRML